MLSCDGEGKDKSQDEGQMSGVTRRLNNALWNFPLTTGKCYSRLAASEAGSAGSLSPRIDTLTVR